MSDVEHELVRENQQLRDRTAELAQLARRALVAAVEAQDGAAGTHEPWLDDALAAVDGVLADRVRAEVSSRSQHRGLPGAP